MKATSAEDTNKAFREKDEKYWRWTTTETREKEAGNAVLVPRIISHDGAVPRDGEAVEELRV